jgi:hypothetical protein
MLLWQNANISGKSVGDIGLNSSQGTFTSDGTFHYSPGLGRGGYQDILNYLKIRTQGKQAQEEYLKLLRERPGRRGTILTNGGDPQIAQTIKTIATAQSEKPTTILGG